MGAYGLIPIWGMELNLLWCCRWIRLNFFLKLEDLFCVTLEVKQPPPGDEGTARRRLSPKEETAMSKLCTVSRL